MKKTKLNPKHLYAIFCLSAVGGRGLLGVQIWQEYSNRQKDIDAFAELSELAEIKEPDEPKKQRSRILTEMQRIRIRIRIPRRNRKTLF